MIVTRHYGGSRKPERHWMAVPAPDPDPGFTGMTEWLPDTQFCGTVPGEWGKGTVAWKR
jgi:hypothetical protein